MSQMEKICGDVIFLWLSHGVSLVCVSIPDPYRVALTLLLNWLLGYDDNFPAGLFNFWNIFNMPKAL